MDAAAIIALIQGLISLAPEAQAAWAKISAIIAANRAPTEEEWTAIQAEAAAAHAAVQAAGV